MQNEMRAAVLEAYTCAHETGVIDGDMYMAWVGS